MNSQCDIILLSYENPDLLKKCVESVLNNTSVPSRLIIIDNASKDPKVKKYIAGVRGNEKILVDKFFSEENLGFAGGINKGLRLSIARYVCILNNDCIVSQGWLKEMIKVASIDASIGLVNPQSNTFGCPTEDATKGKSARYVELGSIIGFACLIKREVLDQIGMLDESYSGVCYEDTDFSCRAHKVGFMSVMAEGAYVYHKEQASRASLQGRKAIYKKNRELFESRWGGLSRVLFIARKDSFISDYDILKNITRRRAIIDVWIGEQDKQGIDRVLGENNIVRHADIGFRTFSGRVPVSKIITKILTKKKKYNAVITRELSLYKRLPLIAGFRKTKVFFLRDDKYLVSSRGEVRKIEDAVFI